MFHTGRVRVTSTSFLENEAGREGLAILSIGSIQQASNLTFSNNTLHCPTGEFGYEKIADEVM